MYLVLSSLLVLCVGVVCWCCVLVLCVGVVCWCCVLVLFAGVVCWCLLVGAIDATDDTWC